MAMRSVRMRGYWCPIAVIVLGLSFLSPWRGLVLESQGTRDRAPAGAAPRPPPRKHNDGKRVIPIPKLRPEDWRASSHPTDLRDPRATEVADPATVGADVKPAVVDAKPAVALPVPTEGVPQAAQGTALMREHVHLSESALRPPLSLPHATDLSVKETDKKKEPIRDVYARSAKETCAFLADPVMNRNCLSLFQRPDLNPLHSVNRDALRYALGYMEVNGDGFKDLTCAKASARKAGLPTRFRNKCSFVVNDLERSLLKIKLRSQAYLIDLCATKVDKVIRGFSSKKGKGPMYYDVNNAKSTVAGVFVTDDQLRRFEPYKKRGPYKALERYFKGKIPALDITPLHSTNNTSLDDKPLHVSPWDSSWGCPAIDKKDADILRKLAEKGPSLWFNYGLKGLHPTASLYKCDAVPEKVTQSKTAIGKIRKDSQATGTQ